MATYFVNADNPDFDEILMSGDTVIVTSGYSVNGLSVAAGATLANWSGSTAANITVRGSMSVQGGASADTVTVQNSGVLTISAGGSVQNITQQAGGKLIITADSDTYASGTNENGVFSVSGGTASGLILYEGSKLNAGGNADGYSFENITVKSNAVLDLTADGTAATGITCEQGAIINAVVSKASGITAAGVYSGGGEFSLSAEGVAENFEVSRDMALSVRGDGKCSNATVYAGGVLALLGDGARAEDTVILNDGKLNIYAEAVIRNITVAGTLTFVDASATGETFGADAQNTGLLLDITGKNLREDAVISDISRIRNAVYSVAVKANQANGFYYLAGGTDYAKYCELGAFDGNSSKAVWGQLA